MKRRFASLLVVLGVVALSGCTFGRNPFDYAGTVVGPNGPTCNFLARRGSLFVPIGETPPTIPYDGPPTTTTPTAATANAEEATGDEVAEPSPQGETTENDWPFSDDEPAPRHATEGAADSLRE